MARTNATNFSGGLQYPYATAGTDLFKKEDVQTLALAVDGHDHSTGKGLPIAAGAIPNGAITLARMAADSVDSSKIVDGSIATADLANASVTNAKLASDTARANLLTNGGFEIWQRGAGPFTGQAVYGADRWNNTLAGTDTLSVSKDTTNRDVGSGAAAAVTFVLGTGAGGTALRSYHPMADSPQLVGRTLSLSVRIRTSTANAVRVRLNDAAALNVYSSFHSGSGAYETLTATGTVGVGATLLVADINFVASCTAYIDNAMLVVGSQPADYVPMHPADDLARCLRYYEIIGEVVGGISWQGYGAASAGATQLVKYAARKAVNPTITKNGGTWTVANCGQPSATAGGPDLFSLYVLVTALGGFLCSNSSVGQTFSIESNP